MQTYTFLMNNLWYVINPTSKTIYSTTTKPTGITEKPFNPQDGIGLSQIPDPNSSNPQPVLINSQGIKGPTNVTINGRNAILNDTTGLDANGQQTRTSNGTVIYEDGTIDRVPLSQIYITSTGYAPATFNATQQAMRDVYVTNTNAFTPLNTYKLPTPAATPPSTPTSTQETPPPAAQETVSTPQTPPSSPPVNPVQETETTPTSQTSPSTPTSESTPVTGLQQQVQPTSVTPDPVPTPLTPQNPPVNQAPATPAVDYSTLPHILISPRWAQDGWATSNGVQAGDKIYADGSIISPDGTIKKEMNGLVSSAFKSNTQSYIYPASQNTPPQEAATIPPPASPVTQSATVASPPTTTTSPVAETTPPPATTYTPPAGSIYATYPGQNYKLYQDGTMVNADGTIKSTGNESIFNWVMNYKDTPGGIPNGWTLNKDGTQINPANVTWNNNVASYSNTPTPSNPLIPTSQTSTPTVSQTPRSIDANPLPLSSILGSSNGQLNWNLSNWTSTGSNFNQTPILTVNGQNFTFSSPGEYVNALKQLKNISGNAGAFDQYISEFNNVSSAFQPTTTTGNTQSYNLADYAPQPLPQTSTNNSNSSTIYNANTTVNPNGTLAQSNTTPNVMPPNVQLAPGSTDTANVKKLQDYLVSKGLLDNAKITGANVAGYGVYGPATTAAVTALQQQLGINATSTGMGVYGPATSSAATGSVTTPSTTTAPPQSNTTTSTPQATNTTSSNPFIGPVQANKYIIQTGDDLTKIAAKYGISVQELQLMNPSITNPSLIFAGQQLQVPNTTPLGNAVQSTISPNISGTNAGQNTTTTSNTTTPVTTQTQPSVATPGAGIVPPTISSDPNVLTLTPQGTLPGTNTNVTNGTPTNTTPNSSNTLNAGGVAAGVANGGLTQPANTGLPNTSTLGQLNPILQTFLQNPANKSQYDALPQNVKDFVNQNAETITKGIEAGKVVNPNIKITPAQVAQIYSATFEDTAKGELDPYYTDTYNSLKSQIDQSLGRLTEDYNTAVQRAADPFKQALQDQSETEAQAGTAFSSGRVDRQNTKVTDQTNALADAFKSTTRSAQDVLQPYEAKVGTEKARQLNLPSLSTYTASNTGFNNTGTRTLDPALQGSVLYGTVGADRQTAIKNRASQLEQVYRTDRALNNATL